MQVGESAVYSDIRTFLLFYRWYAKRFLHPDVVASFEYIFIWDEDLGVEHFNGEK
jgi:hypothetical protein